MISTHFGGSEGVMSHLCPPYSWCTCIGASTSAFGCFKKKKKEKSKVVKRHQPCVQWNAFQKQPPHKTIG